MQYRITVTAIGPRGGLRGSDTYTVTETELFGEPDADVGQLIRAMAVRAVEGKDAQPLLRDSEDEDDGDIAPDRG